MLESGTFAGGKERLKHAAELSGKISFTPPLWQWCERQHLLPPSCSFLTTHPKAFHGAICVPCMDTETVGQRHLPGANSSSEAELRVKPSMLLFLRIHHLKAPFKAQRRGKTSASSIKTPGAVHKPIPTESPPFPPPSPSQLPGEARHLRFHFAPLLCLLHLPQKSIGKLACAWRGGGTGLHCRAEILAWGRGCSCRPDGAGGDSCCHPHSCHIPPLGCMQPCPTSVTMLAREALFLLQPFSP